jgi:hypothetical protein
VLADTWCCQSLQEDSSHGKVSLLNKLVEYQQLHQVLANTWRCQSLQMHYN